MIRRLLKDKRGLTLMELVVVLSILGILAAIVTPAVTGATTGGRATAAKGDIKNTQEAVDRYQGDEPASKYPTSDGAAATTALSTSGVTTGMLKAIYWNATFTDPRDATKSKTFVPDYLRLKPAHADQDVVLASGDTVNTFFDGAEVTLTMSGAYSGKVWNLTSDGKVILLLSGDQY